MDRDRPLPWALRDDDPPDQHRLRPLGCPHQGGGGGPEEDRGPQREHRGRPRSRPQRRDGHSVGLVIGLGLSASITSSWTSWTLI